MAFVLWAMVILRVYEFKEINGHSHTAQAGQGGHPAVQHSSTIYISWNHTSKEHSQTTLQSCVVGTTALHLWLEAHDMWTLIDHAQQNKQAYMQYNFFHFINEQISFYIWMLREWKCWFWRVHMCECVLANGRTPECDVRAFESNDG